VVHKEEISLLEETANDLALARVEMLAECSLAELRSFSTLLK
jgi:hypothetical protein